MHIYAELVPDSSQCYHLQENSYLEGSGSSKHMADGLRTLRTVLNQVWDVSMPILSHSPATSETAGYPAYGSETVYIGMLLA